MKFKFALIGFIALFSANFGYGQNTLDNIGLTSSTPASVAFSLRQLSTSYTGPLVRIKVGTSFYDVYPDASTKNFSLSSKISASVSTYNAGFTAPSANALSTIISGSTDATVAIWYDQSGNGTNVLTNSSLGPKIINQGSILLMYGKPTVYFAGAISNSVPLVSSSTVNYNSQQTATINAVAQNIGSTSNISGIYSTGLSGGWGLNYDPTASAPGYWLDGSGCNQAFSGATSTTPKIITGFLNKTTNSSIIYENSVLKGTKTMTCNIDNGIADKICIGVRAENGGSRKFDGNISEVILFPSILSNSNQTLLETNQNTTYFSPFVTITSSASSNTICTGTNVTFTANAQNFSNTPTYQWFKNGVAITGATSSTYSTTSLANNDIINVSCSNSSNIVSDNSLALCLDAGNVSSYSGTGTTWYDISGNNKNATLTSDQSFSSGDGGSIQFNGGQNAVSIPLVSANTANVTMQTWVYLDANTKGPFFKNGSNNGYVFGTGNGGNGFEVGNKATMLFAGARWITTTTNYGYGWKLVTMVLNSSGVPSMYINNTQVSGTYTGNNALTPNTGSYLGRNVGDDDVNWPKFNGKMAAVYFYTKALSQSEINQNYDALAARFGFSAAAISSNTITTTISTPTVTITSSASGAVCAGTAITFTATVGCIPSPTYQWTKNGIGIPGATSSTYSSTSLSNNDVIKVWVNAGIDNSAIVSNGLLLNLDASNPGSYSGTGNTWYDLSGNNNHGTLMNSPTYDAASGSIITNGTNQYISIPQVSTANTNITMQAWVYVNLNTTGTFIKNGTGGGGYSIGIGNWAYDQVGSNVVMLLYGRGWIGSGVSYGTAGWKLVTLTLDGSSTAKAYVNGTLIGTYTWPTPTSPSGPLNLGANIGDGNIYYNGKFAAAYFYNRALSQAEILQNYNAFATKSTGYGSNTITISLNGSIPTISVNGDGCINKTTLSTTSGLTSYTWYKDNIAISGASSNTYIPTTAGDYKVQVSNGTCTNTSASTTMTACGLTAEGKLIPIENSTTLVSKDGATNSGKGIDERGLIITKPIYYGTVTTRTGRIWLDRNLGASRVALSPTDTQAYGDYYQWGRRTDGHEKQIVRGLAGNYTGTKSATSVPPDDKYIFPSDGSFDWLITSDNTLWSGLNAPNNPCPAGFRIPTESEWAAEAAVFTSNNVAGSFEAGYGLKLTVGGMATSQSYITAIGNYGQYLTQTAYDNGRVKYFGVISYATWFDTNYYKTTGQSCRCIKN